MITNVEGRGRCSVQSMCRKKEEVSFALLEIEGITSFHRKHRKHDVNTFVGIRVFKPEKLFYAWVLMEFGKRDEISSHILHQKINQNKQKIQSEKETAEPIPIPSPT